MCNSIKYSSGETYKGRKQMFVSVSILLNEKLNPNRQHQCKKRCFLALRHGESPRQQQETRGVIKTTTRDTVSHQDNKQRHGESPRQQTWRVTKTTNRDTESHQDNKQRHGESLRQQTETRRVTKITNRDTESH